MQRRQRDIDQLSRRRQEGRHIDGSVGYDVQAARGAVRGQHLCGRTGRIGGVPGHGKGSPKLCERGRQVHAEDARLRQNSHPRQRWRGKARWMFWERGGGVVVVYAVREEGEIVGVVEAELATLPTYTNLRPVEEARRAVEARYEAWKRDLAMQWARTGTEQLDKA